MIIQHNIFALNTNNNVVSNTNVLIDSQEKLSSGFRINHAGDDAAGLSISEKMRSQLHGLNRSKRNCYDGISLVQTAEGALNTVNTILHRMTELAAESANGTYENSVDRKAIQLEISQLKQEINHIAESTTFGNINILDGSLSKSGEICIGPKASTQQTAHSGPLVYVYEEVIHDVNASQTATGTATMTGYDALKTALKDQIVPQAVSALTDTFSDTFSYLDGSRIGIGLELYSSSSSSVLASVGVGAAGTLGDINLSYTLKVNMAHLNMDSRGNLTADSRRELEATIAHEMMHALMDEAHTAGMIGRDNNWQSIADFPDWFVEGAAQTVGGARDWVNSIGINSNSTTNDIKNIISNNANKIGSGSTSSQYATGYLAVMYLGHLAGGSTTSTGLVNGVDSILRELKAGSSLDTVISDLTGCADTTDFERQFADIGADFVADLMDAVGNGRGSLVGGDLTQTDLLPDANDNNTLFALNTTNTKVKNDYPNGYNVMSGGGRSDDGVSPDGTAPTPGGIGSGGGSGPGSGNSGGSAPGIGQTPDGEQIHHGLVLHLGAGSKDTAEIYIESVSTTSLGLDEVDVSTRESANASLDMIHDASNKLSGQRAEIGAYFNRLQHKIDNLTVASQNLKASESYIRDIDMASEISNCIVNSILQDAGTALLSQANSIKQGILSLLS